MNPSNDAPPAGEATATPLPPRAWPAVLLITILWLFRFIAGQMELTTFERFGALMVVKGLVLILFIVWWLVGRRMSWKEKLGGLLGIVLLSFICERLGHPSMHGMVWLIMVIPAVLTVWAGWWLITRKQPPRIRTGGLVLIVLLTCATYSLIRMDGLSGEQSADLHWRWSPTREQLYLAQLSPTHPPPTSTAAEGTLTSTANDWPGFRGLGRDGIVSGLAIATDWSANPPRLLWRVRVGPGWSSPVAIGGRVFTQEQRGPSEVVACRNLTDGKDCWTHEDPVRFEEGMSGAGPRATPLFVDGKLFTLGATGVLNCLDAATWKRQMVRRPRQRRRQPPHLGFLKLAGCDARHGDRLRRRSQRPHRLSRRFRQTRLVRSIRRAKLLLAATHENRRCRAGRFPKRPQRHRRRSLTGKQLWEEVISAPGAPRAIQPHAISDSQLLVSSETDLGTALLEISNTNGAWAAKRKWVTRSLKPSFNDFVVLDGFVYGFDGAVFCCTNLSDGKRKWREGRYGHGQVLLLQDQKLLLVLGEEGEVILLRATPDKNDELARFTAITGKTWNHPAIARGNLIVRNGEEMACFDLQLPTK